MQFGICDSISHAGELLAAGADFVEEHVQRLLQGTVEDAQWKNLAGIRRCPLPILAANCLVPGEMKIVGPDVDFQKLGRYMDNVIRRARLGKIKYLIFGSAAARNVPDGFDRGTAHRQIVDFARLAGELGAAHGVTILAEPLCRAESNIINSVAEAVSYVKAVEHANFQCLVDTYHFWSENETLASLESALPYIRHVHVADRAGRVGPGQSSSSDYGPMFHLLKAAGYSGAISVEAAGMSDYKTVVPRVVSFLKTQWEQA